MLYFPDGSVTVENTTSEIIVQLQSEFSHQFTFSEVASDLSSSPAETSQILNELQLAIASPGERECAAQHYRDWLETQGGVCENAAAEGALAVGAGSVALGSCMQFNRAPNQANGLVGAGSYVVLLIQGWRASNATDDCLAEYPGPGNEC